MHGKNWRSNGTTILISKTSLSLSAQTQYREPATITIPLSSYACIRLASRFMMTHSEKKLDEKCSICSYLKILTVVLGAEQATSSLKILLTSPYRCIAILSTHLPSHSGKNSDHKCCHDHNYNILVVALTVGSDIFKISIHALSSHVHAPRLTSIKTHHAERESTMKYCHSDNHENLVVPPWHSPTTYLSILCSSQSRKAHASDCLFIVAACCLKFVPCTCS